MIPCIENQVVDQTVQVILAGVPAAAADGAAAVGTPALGCGMPSAQQGTVCYHRR
jgi:hypothetical protein